MPMPRAIRTHAAEQDLDEIAWYLAVHENRPQVAYKIIDEINYHPLKQVGLEVS